LFFTVAHADYCDAVSGYFNTGSVVLVLRQSDIFIHSVIFFV
jgi:hypothetical protein